MKIVCHFAMALALAAFAVAPARAHFIWAAIAPDAAGKTAAQLWFSEGAAPGEANLLAKVAHSKAWRRDAQGQVTELRLREERSAGGGAWLATLDSDAPCSIEAECIYGTFDRGAGPMMLEYYAKTLHRVGAAEMAELGRAEKLALDVVPAVDAAGTLKLTVLWKGSPVSGSDVTVIGPNDEDRQLKTDAAGQCEVAIKAPGMYAIRAFRNEPETEGEHEGKKYRGVRRYSTLTFELATNETSASEAPTADANQMLAHARDQRALWDGFPGFEAKLTLEDGKHDAQGKLKITSDGEVELTGFGDVNLDWVRAQMESMVQHRFSGNGPESDVELVSESTRHPLGALVRFKEDPSMHSAYRIDGDVIAQVNRQMGKNRMSINVIDVYRNPEGKYLPSVFQVSFWDQETGELKSSMSCYNSWTRVGGYDLPVRFTIVEVGDNKHEARTLLFNEQKLLVE